MQYHDMQRAFTDINSRHLLSDLVVLLRAEMKAVSNFHYGGSARSQK